MKNVFAIAPLFLALVSCGSDEKKTETASPESAFVGTWATDCIKTSEVSYLQTTNTFNSDKTASNEIAGFADASCLQKTFSTIVKFNFTVTGEGEQGSKVVQTTLTEIKTTYFIDSTIELANSTQQCESGAWTKGVETNCTNKKVDSNSSAEVDAVQKAGFKSEIQYKIEATKMTSLTANGSAVFTKK
jgi:hypothetical protein